MNLGFLDNENRLFSYKDEEYDDSSDLSLHIHSTPIASRFFSDLSCQLQIDFSGNESRLFSVH
jgi:hypothetical protein